MNAAAPQQDSPGSLMKFLKGAGSAGKLAVGAGTIAMGVTIITALSPLAAALFGGIALVAGGRQVYEGGKALFGNAAEKKPSWKTKLGRAADSLGVGWTGALGFFIGGFALGLGSTAALPAAVALAGIALMTASTLQLTTQAGTAIWDAVKFVRASKAGATLSPVPAAAPDLSPAPKVGTLEAAPGFDKAAAPETKAAAPAPQPVVAPPAPRP